MSCIFRTYFAGSSALVPNPSLPSLVPITPASFFSNTDDISSSLPVVGPGEIGRMFGVGLVPAADQRACAVARSSSIAALLVADLRSHASFVASIIHYEPKFN